MQSSDAEYQMMINEQNLLSAKNTADETPAAHKPKIVRQKKEKPAANKSYFNLGKSPLLATKESSKPENAADKIFAAYPIKIK